MKTRQEMIYDFMVALASSPLVAFNDNVDVDTSATANWICIQATDLADEYLATLS